VTEKDLLAGIFEPAVWAIDLAILLSKARQHSLAVSAERQRSFSSQYLNMIFKVLADTLKQWKSRSDWVGDEQYRAYISSHLIQRRHRKYCVIAADWVLERLPIEYQPILHKARQTYLGHNEDNLAARADQTAAFILFAKSAIIDLLGTHNARGR
jgi:streptomycin 3"-adenylyltransferase